MPPDSLAVWWEDEAGVRGGQGRRPDQVAFSATVAGIAALGLVMIALACAAGLLG